MRNNTHIFWRIAKHYKRLNLIGRFKVLIFVCVCVCVCVCVWGGGATTTTGDKACFLLAAWRFLACFKKNTNNDICTTVFLLFFCGGGGGGGKDLLLVTEVLIFFSFFNKNLCVCIIRWLAWFLSRSQKLHHRV